MFVKAREKIRAFEDAVAARLSKTEQRELNRLLTKLRGGQEVLATVARTAG